MENFERSHFDSFSLDTTDLGMEYETRNDGFRRF